MRHESAVAAFLARVQRRLTIRSAAIGAAAGLGLAGILGLLGWPSTAAGIAGTGAVLAVSGILILVFIYRDVRRDVARFVEARVPTSRNLILTAAELPPGSPTYARAMVLERANALAATQDAAALVPASRVAAASIAALLVWSVAIARAGTPIVSRNVARALGLPAGPIVSRVDVTVVPPAYTGRSAQTLHDPSRVEVLAGSRIELSARGRAASLAVETISSHDTLAFGRGGATTSLRADGDGFVALQPIDGARVGARRLIGLTVLPDSAPHVKITAPGRDVVLPDGNRSLDVAIEADDDIALGSLVLRYTKVSGSGERFTFAEGEVPIQVVRRDERHWSATARWPLASLELGPGDMVVYRAAAADRRPGAIPTESDAFIAEVAAPGGVAAPGFSLDPEQERYAVSQQMVILKTERLLAKRASMSPEAYANEATELAAEQRKVRAEFVFMLGGELADASDVAASMTDLNEEEEAAGEADLLAGRNANAGHIALLRAIRSMSRAAASLTIAEVEPALPHERAALKSLESAFSRARILLRALTTRERLDSTRRLTGSLADAARELRPSTMPTISGRTAALRRALADLADLAGRRTLDAPSAANASAIAERLLQIDASSKALQNVAAEIDDAARRMSANRQDDARGLLDAATTALSLELRRGLGGTPAAAPSVDDALLRGALSDRLRRGARP